MTVLEQKPAALLQRIKQLAKDLEHFDEDSLRDVLFKSAGSELSKVTRATAGAMSQQISTIRNSKSSLDSILERMNIVQANVQEIDSSVESVVAASKGSSSELERVSERMRVLEQQFTAIDGLIRAVNDIADQTHLLSLNATIEASRAGDAGRGFAVVAAEVKELATTTKSTNKQIHETLDGISASVATLSASVDQSVEKMSRSISAVEATRISASTIGNETANFVRELNESRSSFQDLDESSAGVENEIQEISTIGNTFAYLVELLAQNGESGMLNPLHRLRPLIEQSDFEAAERFATREPAYELTEDDALISATDTRGMITFANNSFYRVAEFEPGELIGKPHNQIRHPDMPRTAFADLWSVIQSGRLWQGYVANRSKNGTLYWVKATVFPCLENSKVVGYISIRTKPERARIEEAIKAYRLVP